MRRILLVGGFLLLGLVFVCVVVAGGPYTRWVQPGAVVYTDPDSAADVSVTVTKTVAVSVTLTTGWAEITSPPELAGFVQTSQLLKEEPSALKVQRDADAQKAKDAALAARKVGDLSWGELVAFLKQLLGQPVTAASAPATALATTTYVVKAGDSLSLIAARYGVNWVDLAKANNISSPWRIEVGQSMTIPVAPVTATVSTSGWPRTAAEFLALTTAGQPAAPDDRSWIPIQIGEIHRPVGESNAWAVTREKNKEGLIIPFWVRNYSGRAQDGYCMVGGKYATGTPANFAGLSQGVTFRP